MFVVLCFHRAVSSCHGVLGAFTELPSQAIHPSIYRSAYLSIYLSIYTACKYIYIYIHITYVYVYGIRHQCLHTHVPKRQAHNARTKTAFLKRRRAASDALINTTSTCNAESSIANVKTALGWNWADSHQREKLFANNKEVNKKLEAYRDGALLPSEIDAALVARSEVDEARDKNKSVGLMHIQKRILF